MSKRLLILACALMLGGCALPVPLQIASWAIDGLLFITTEKTMADHGVSLVVQRDCAMLRVVTEGALCREADPTTAVAVAELSPPAGINAAVHDALNSADGVFMTLTGESPRAYQVASLAEGADFRVLTSDDEAVLLASLDTAAGGGSEAFPRDSIWQEAPVEKALTDEAAVAAARWQAIIDAPSFFDHPMEPAGLESIPVSMSEFKPGLTAESTPGPAFVAPAEVGDAFDVRRGDDRLNLGVTGHGPYLNGTDSVTLLGGEGDDSLASGFGGDRSPPPIREIAQYLGKEGRARRRRPPGCAGVRGRGPPDRRAWRRRVHDPQGP